MAPSLQIVGQQDACSHGVAVNIFDADDKNGVEPKEYKGKAAIITLGCAKNQVDSEVMLGVLLRRGFEIVNDVAEADIAIVNTCSFLESAVQESIDSILEVADYKDTGRLRKLIVAGCMVSRYRDELIESMPEVDAFVTLDELLEVDKRALGETEAVFEDAARPYFLYDDSTPRFVASKRHMAYVKVAEGCNRPCTFCIIPKIRGSMRSRSIDSVVREVISLGEQGVREINLVAQDLTSYGTDHKQGNLTTLLQKLDDTKAVDWIRLLYAYPIGIDEALLDTIMERQRICEYLDLPLQHSSEAVLKAMKRPVGRYAPRAITEFIKNRQPLLHMRTTFIVGFPGETEQDILDLERFVREGHFSSVGVFTYSQEADTPAAELVGQLSEEEKLARKELIMKAQKETLASRLDSYLDSTIEVMFEGVHPETDLLFEARARFQAPDVDGTVIINDSELPLTDLVPGAIHQVEITEVTDYDLVGCLKAGS
ncbi:MAG: 30S ribosomal protein S12 methylthiotransferase RimO [Bdellovibrionales bacterium]|nr:30S ribosomal protein S12 methylthiotransferase RimO [Bdellovibrionales bacterium]